MLRAKLHSHLQLLASVLSHKALVNTFRRARLTSFVFFALAIVLLVVIYSTHGYSILCIIYLWFPAPVAWVALVEDHQLPLSSDLLNGL